MKPFALLFLLALPCFGAPESPKTQLGRAYWLMVAAQAGTMVADYEVTQQVQRRYFYWHEDNPAFGPQPSRARMYAIGIPTYAALAVVGARLKRRGRWYWWMPQAAGIAGAAYGLQQNLRWASAQRRSHD